MTSDTRALADAVAATAHTQGQTTPSVRGSDWKTATVTAVDEPVGTVTCGAIVARRMAEAYTAPAVGDRVVITRSGAGNWLAWGRTSGSAGEWTVLTLASGFTAADSGYPPGWLREGRRIWLRGRVAASSGTIANGATIFTLPAALRPAGAYDVGFSVARNAPGGSAHPNVIRVDIAAAGTVRIFEFASLPTWVGLDGISYLTA